MLGKKTTWVRPCRRLSEVVNYYIPSKALIRCRGGRIIGYVANVFDVASLRRWAQLERQRSIGGDVVQQVSAVTKWAFHFTPGNIYCCRQQRGFLS